ncbi:hypothetical protein G6F24_017468 [Rhizopus arrhizus]|nr:hypothetical protein G6F24_017468 [Rhizopus arrhizus]
MSDFLHGDCAAEVLHERSGCCSIGLLAGLSEVVCEEIFLGQLKWGHSTPPSASVMTVRLGLSRGCTGNSSLGSWSRYALSSFVLRGPETLMVQMFRFLLVFR